VKKLMLALLFVALLPVGLVLMFLATGKIHTSSIGMILNVAGIGGVTTNEQLVEQSLRGPEGYSLQLYATDLKHARFLRFTSEGDLLVSRPHSGDIQLLKRDRNGDGRPDAVSTLVADLNRPLGIDFLDSWLYIAESNRIGRIRYDAATGQTSGDYDVVVEGLTDNGNHWTKTLRVGPDGLLYLTQGSTCNVCEEEDQRRATLMRFQPDGSKPEIIATGLRNSVGFDWAPWNGEIYATDNGRDLMGDDFPPCELNRIESGGFYGWPYFNGKNVPDPEMGDDPSGDVRTAISPVHAFRAHNAPLGITFLDAQTLPSEYQQSALVALHGSWNRSEPDGYKVVSLHWSENGIEERDFLSGFNNKGSIIGRPVDVAQGPDGAIYVSDDYAGAIYRLSYIGAATNSSGLNIEVKSLLDQTPPNWLADADLVVMANNGEQLFKRFNCQNCHGNKKGQASLANLSQRLGYGAVIAALEKPQANMPLFPLNEEERREIAVYLLSHD